MVHANPEAASAESRVAGPGAALIVVGVLSSLWAVGSMLQGLFGFANGVMYAYSEQEQMIQAATSTGTILFGLAAFVFGIIMAVGGWKMRNLEGYTLAVIATVLAVFPCCVGCCWVVSLPVGIWSAVVLMDEGVKGAFH